jgi:hypothetical protein
MSAHLTAKVSCDALEKREFVRKDSQMGCNLG